MKRIVIASAAAVALIGGVVSTSGANSLVVAEDTLPDTPPISAPVEEVVPETPPPTEVPPPEPVVATEAPVVTEAPVPTEAPVIEEAIAPPPPPPITLPPAPTPPPIPSTLPPPPPPVEKVCPPLDSGKIDTPSAGSTLTITAPAGYLIDRYCVKAGSIKQGNGPEFVNVSPPQKSVTISHSSGKDISHYSASYVKIIVTTTTTTEPKPEFEYELRCSSFETARFLNVIWTYGNEGDTETIPLKADEGPGDEIEVTVNVDGKDRTFTVIVPDDPICRIPTTTTTTEPEVTTTTTEPEVTTTTTEPEVTTTTEPEVTTTTEPEETTTTTEPEETTTTAPEETTTTLPPPPPPPFNPPEECPYDPRLDVDDPNCEPAPTPNLPTTGGNSTQNLLIGALGALTLGLGITALSRRKEDEPLLD